MKTAGVSPAKATSVRRVAAGWTEGCAQRGGPKQERRKTMATGAELTYTTASAIDMANAIFGPGVTVQSATYTGQASSAAIYSNGQLAPGVVPSNTGVILSTGLAASFTQSNGDPNRSAGTSADTSGPNNNALFNALAGTNTFDASFLDVTFVPNGNMMTMQFVFGSEEYPEYINSQFNDIVGVWVNGVSVPMTVNGGTASVNNINGATQQNLFVNNQTDAYNTEMDGFTVTLSLSIPVTAGVANTIRIGIADVGDSGFDSNLLIAGDSIQTSIIAVDDAETMGPNGTRVLRVLDNDTTSVGSLVITHINGQPVVAGQTITLPSGEQIRLNADGTFTAIANGTVETQSFTYTVSNGQGGTDIGLVTLSMIPCFVAGTRIATPMGEVAVEALQPGDLVLTRDDGPQPLRWIGRRTVPAVGRMAPIAIAGGALGDHGALQVSPEHRVMLTHSLAEMLFGEPEVLVPAKMLVNDTTIRPCPGGTVDYVHLMFDRHQVIWSEGLETESFFPASQSLGALDCDALAELCAIFPELDPKTGEGYGPAARRVLKGFEVQVMMGPGTLDAAA